MNISKTLNSPDRSLLLRACLASKMTQIHKNLLENLLKEGQDPNLMVAATLNDNGQKIPIQLSLLSYAALTRNIHLIDILVKHGANPNIQDSSLMKTPLHWAMAQNVTIEIGENKIESGDSSPDTAWALIEAGADTSLVDSNGSLYDVPLTDWTKEKWNFRIRKSSF